MQKTQRPLQAENRQYYQPKDLCTYYGVSRSTVQMLLREFRSIPKYADYYKAITHNLTLVNLEKFDKFLKEKSRKQLRT